PAPAPPRRVPNGTGTNIAPPPGVTGPQPRVTGPQPRPTGPLRTPTGPLRTPTGTQPGAARDTDEQQKRNTGEQPKLRDSGEQPKLRDSGEQQGRRAETGPLPRASSPTPQPSASGSGPIPKVGRNTLDGTGSAGTLKEQIIRKLAQVEGNADYFTILGLSRDA